MQAWLRRKDIDQVTVHEEGRRLVPTLSWPHLVALGIGAIVGTGIYTLIGVGANLAGPAVLISFLVAGIVCACAALAYAEMATMMPAAGSAYTYSYAVLGETIAWIVGWSLILEYTLVVSTVAVGWSGYFVGFLPEPVPRAVIERILALAQRTASWCNCQPWQVAVTEGAATERLRQALETPGKRGVLLDIFAVFIQRGRTDAVQFAARQGGL